MKYLYTTIFLLCSFSLFAQNRYWVGGTSGDWYNTANWSTTSGGAGGASVPSASDLVIFNTNADVSFSTTGDISVLGVHVLNNAIVKFLPTANKNFNLSSTSTNISDLALYVAAGAEMIDSSLNNMTSFLMNFGPNAHGIIDGTVAMGGVELGTNPGANGRSRFNFEGGSDLKIRNGGVYRMGNTFSSPSISPSNMIFEEGSYLMYNIVTGGSVGTFNMHDNSTLVLYGYYRGGALPAFSVNTLTYPNIIVDIAGFDVPFNNPALQFNNGTTILGDLTFKNTGGEQLIFSHLTSSDFTLNINGNLVIQNSADVVLGSHNNHASTIVVGGNLVMTDGFLKFRKTPNVATIYSNPVTLKVLGNIVQTGGTITTGDVDVASITDEMFVIEMAGTTAQTINASGSWDNSTQNIVLRINNSNGVNLASQVLVSKLSWNSTNKGIINATVANPITILNTNASDTTAMYGAGNTGYVNGPVRRMTTEANWYHFPTGNNGVYRPVSVLPQTNTLATYEAQYWNQAFSNLTVNPVMNGVANNEYWRVNRVTGSTPASVGLSWSQQIPGTTSNDGIVVASFSGSQWNSEYAGVNATMHMPGNSTSGGVRTDYITPNRYYTFGFGTSITLPINLVNFNVQKVNNDAAMLTWEVSAESTPASFVIERSIDGVAFAAISTVPANNVTHYQYNDTRLPSGKIYYRLKMVDQDGSFTYSDVQSIVVNLNEHTLQVFPTIATTQTQLKIELVKASKISVVVHDNSGKIITRIPQQLSSGTHYLPISTNALANGVYYVIVIYEDGSSSTPLRFIKQ